MRGRVLVSGASFANTVPCVSSSAFQKRKTHMAHVDFPIVRRPVSRRTHGKRNVFAAFGRVFAQICARSTDILHGNYPLLAATSRFNAYQALQLYTKSSQKSIPLVQLFTCNTNLTFDNFTPISWSLCTKTSAFHQKMRFFKVHGGCFTAQKDIHRAKWADFFVMFLQK